MKTISRVKHYYIIWKQRKPRGRLWIINFKTIGVVTLAVPHAKLLQLPINRISVMNLKQRKIRKNIRSLDSTFLHLQVAQMATLLKVKVKPSLINFIKANLLTLTMFRLTCPLSTNWHKRNLIYSKKTPWSSRRVKSLKKKVSFRFTVLRLKKYNSPRVTCKLFNLAT